jgi:hypothetical protein
MAVIAGRSRQPVMASKPDRLVFECHLRKLPVTRKRIHDRIGLEVIFRWRGEHLVPQVTSNQRAFGRT